MTGSRHILVTGGAGFIGSHLVDLLLANEELSVTVLDKLTYAGNMANLDQHQGEARLTFVRGDVADADAVAPLVKEADFVIHAAAESFVDRSIDDAAAFVSSNVGGTHVVLEACRKGEKPMVLVSTDEVYGSTRASAFSEEDAMRPNSPYAATKAGADLLCRAYHVTYGLPVSVVRGSNAYGPRQHPEKAIPTFALSALQGNRIPVYGKGANRREWLHVTDFARAVTTVMRKGQPGAVYNIGGGHEITNLQLARMICTTAKADESLIEFVEDRPGHDLRYSLLWKPLAALGWFPRVPFHEGLRATVDWYREHGDWTRSILDETAS
jgi:dTDP-glucose 4,6-dehydratase